MDKVDLDEVESIIPETFYAGRPVLERLEILVDHWNRATSIIQRLEEDG